MDSNIISNEGKDLHITVSIGVTGFSGEDDSNSLIKRVDNALLLTKERGKNRVEYL